MAKVYTIEELEAQVLEFIQRLQSVYRSLLAARTRRENMYGQGETLANIDTQLTADLSAIKGVTDQIGAELTAMIFTNAIEVRVGLERKVNSLNLDLVANPGIIETLDDDGVAVDVGLSGVFATSNIIEVVDAEDAANSRLITLSGTHTGSKLEFAQISGGVDNDEDTKAKIILRDDT